MTKEIENIFKVDKEVYPKLSFLSPVWKEQWKKAVEYVLNEIEDEDEFVKVIKRTYDPFILAAAYYYLRHVRMCGIITYEVSESCLKILIKSVEKIETENVQGYKIFTLLTYKKQ